MRKTISVALSENSLDILDRYAKKRERSRSEAARLLINWALVSFKYVGEIEMEEIFRAVCNGSRLDETRSPELRRLFSLFQEAIQRASVLGDNVNWRVHEEGVARVKSPSADPGDEPHHRLRLLTFPTQPNVDL